MAVCWKEEYHHRPALSYHRLLLCSWLGLPREGFPPRYLFSQYQQNDGQEVSPHGIFAHTVVMQQSTEAIVNATFIVWRRDVSVSMLLLFSVV
jgi:hypothetical protein